MMMLVLFAAGLAAASGQDVTTFTHRSPCVVGSGLCECPEKHICDVHILSPPGSSGDDWNYQAISDRGELDAVRAHQTSGGVKFVGAIRNFKCNAPQVATKSDWLVTEKMCHNYIVESTYETGTEIECISALGNGCRNAVFTGSIKSVVCEAGDWQWEETDTTIADWDWRSSGRYDRHMYPKYEYRANDHCKEMTVLSTGTPPTNVTCHMRPTETDQHRTLMVQSNE